VPRVLARLTVAAVLAATVGLGLPGPAEATTCSTASGVSVVVDFHQLGGGVQTYCDVSGAGKYADAQFKDAGHTLTYVQNEAFVCRVDGVPSSDPCVRTPPADAYWSLWWSDGTSGTWKYSSAGVRSLKVPPGGYVALSWQGGSSQAPPGVAPKAHATASPSPSQSPTPSPTHPPSSPTSHPTTAPPATPTSASAAPSTSPHASPSHTPSATPLGHHLTGGHHHSSSAAPSPASQAAAASTPDLVEPTHSGLPGWVAPGLVALVFATAAAVVVVRRKGAGGS
jgi:hypothetical protein